MPRVAIRVIPKAGADEVAGLRGDEVVVRVKAAPDAGKANAAACKVIARFLGVAPRAVSVIRGHTSRHKVLEVNGPTEGDVASRTAELPQLD